MHFFNLYVFVTAFWIKVPQTPRQKIGETKKDKSHLRTHQLLQGRNYQRKKIIKCAKLTTLLVHLFGVQFSRYFKLNQHACAMYFYNMIGFQHFKTKTHVFFPIDFLGSGIKKHIKNHPLNKNKKVFSTLHLKTLKFCSVFCTRPSLLSCFCWRLCFCSRPAALFWAISVRDASHFCWRPSFGVCLSVLRQVFADGPVLGYIYLCCVTFLLTSQFWGISVRAGSCFCWQRLF